MHHQENVKGKKLKQKTCQCLLLSASFLKRFAIWCRWCLQWAAAAGQSGKQCWPCKQWAVRFSLFDLQIGPLVVLVDDSTQSNGLIARRPTDWLNDWLTDHSLTRSHEWGVPVLIIFVKLTVFSQVVLTIKNLGFQNVDNNFFAILTFPVVNLVMLDHFDVHKQKVLNISAKIATRCRHGNRYSPKSHDCNLAAHSQKNYC